jgi:Holliday junction resolvasome RuvABC DNA-binding subunit
MTGDKYKIVKGYKVFQLAISSDDPMDEPSEQELYGWLCSRGYTEQEAAKIIQRVDEKGEVDITLP